MTEREITQCLNFARALNLITSSRTINGAMVVYDARGRSQSWDSFIAQYPLEKLREMLTEM